MTIEDVTPYDLEAQCAVISTAWEGVPLPAFLLAKHFYSAFHQWLFVFVAEIRELGQAPSIDLALRWVGQHGFRAPWMWEAIDAIVNGVPAVCPIEPLARRIVQLWCRRCMLPQLARVDALSRLVDTPTETIMVELDAAKRALIEGDAR